MPVEVLKGMDQVVTVRVSGKLRKDDYAVFVPQLEELIGQRGKLNMLFDMVDFRGWDAGAAWEDVKFAFRHYHDVERLAIIGEKRWQRTMALLCRPFTSGELRVFLPSQTEEAVTWLKETPVTHAQETAAYAVERGSCAQVAACCTPWSSSYE